MADYASAVPTKRFFLEMLTRDIALEDAVLDLIDNAIDALTRKSYVDFLHDPTALLESHDSPKKLDAFVQISYDKNHFLIVDNCGGIDYEEARDDVFRFGRVTHKSESSLSVYGIGLKRAIFKIGRRISIESKTTSSGFRTSINVPEWIKDEADRTSSTLDIENWSFPLEPISPADNEAHAGTRIYIEDLNPEVSTRFQAGTFKGELSEVIETTYALFLDKYVSLSINQDHLAPRHIPVGESDQVTPSVEYHEVNDIDVTIIAGLQERSAGKWNSERAGWYILCNGRVVVFANKDRLTEWGVGLPQFVSKYRGFIGIVLFFSSQPETLPWTTTKRGINRDSRAFQETKPLMVGSAKPVLQFLNNMYPSEESEQAEQPAERQVASSVKTTRLQQIATKPKSQQFTFTAPEQPADPTVNVQFKARKSEIENAKKALGKKSWSATKIGRYALDYLLKNEA